TYLFAGTPDRDQSESNLLKRLSILGADQKLYLESSGIAQERRRTDARGKASRHRKKSPGDYGDRTPGRDSQRRVAHPTGPWRSDNRRLQNGSLCVAGRPFQPPPSSTPPSLPTPSRPGRLSPCYQS